MSVSRELQASLVHTHDDAERLNALPAFEAAQRMRDGRLTSERLTAACLERIDARETTVRAWSLVDSERALATARERDSEPPRGPLHGLPVGVKDIIDTAGLATEYGSSAYARHQPKFNARCVERLVDAGAVLIGKTVTSEFALAAPGPTRNPRDPRRTPGGSSSGSAAAVADMMVPLALGTQTGGSIIRPAAFCGVFGFKPTFGSVSTWGVRRVAPSLDTVGAFARDITDIRMVMSVIYNHEFQFPMRMGSGSPIRRPRLGFARPPGWECMETTARDAFVELAARLGAVEITLPQGFHDVLLAHERISDSEAANEFSDEHQAHEEVRSPQLLRILQRGREVGPHEYAAALTLTRTLSSAIEATLRTCDVLITPATLGEAPQGVAESGDAIFCRPWSLLGNPVVAVPVLTGAAGLPLGIQVVGSRGSDGATVAAAEWISQQSEHYYAGL